MRLFQEMNNTKETFYYIEWHLAEKEKNFKYANECKRKYANLVKARLRSEVSQTFPNNVSLIMN